MEKEQHSESPLDIPVREQTMERADFEKWAHPILGDNPTWQESGPCELAWQAWKESAKAEREACAAVAEDTAAGVDAEAIAEAIRARSNFDIGRSFAP